MAGESDVHIFISCLAQWLLMRVRPCERSFLMPSEVEKHEAVAGAG